MTIQPERFDNHGAFHLAGIDKAYTYQELSLVATQWTEFGPHLGTIPGQANKFAYGLSYDMGATGFRYLSAAETIEGSALLEGFVTKSLPPYRYAVFAHREHISKIAETIGAIWQDWLPASGCEALAEPITLEVYAEDFCPDVAIGGVEIWIAIKE